MTCERQTWLGAYVLDALEPDESEDVRNHIAGCPTCQDEVVRLSWVPALLRTVALDDVQRLDERPVPHGPAQSPVLDRALDSMRTARADRRWRRPVTVLAGLVAAATVAGAALVGAGGFAHTGHQQVAIRTADPRTHVTAAVTLNRRTWGTELELSLRWVPPGEKCSLVAHARDGRTDVAATWVANYRGDADVPGATAIPLGQLRELDVITSAGRQLARLVVPLKTR